MEKRFAFGLVTYPVAAPYNQDQHDTTAGPLSGLRLPKWSGLANSSPCGIRHTTYDVMTQFIRAMREPGRTC